MRTKHRFELYTYTFIVEIENGIITITDEESDIYIRFKEGVPGQTYKVECVVPFIGYLSSEDRYREVLRVLKKLYEFGSSRFPTEFMSDRPQVPPDIFFRQYGI